LTRGHATPSVTSNTWAGKQIPIARRPRDRHLPIRQRTDDFDARILCKVHELDNLYVVDTRFFPSIGAVNPAPSAIAIAWHDGDHTLPLPAWGL